MKKLIFLISFFSYSGYYAGLAIILSLNLSELSRFYSVPIRVVMALLMIIIIHRHKNLLIKNKNSHYIILFIVFWVFYLLKVLYTESITTNNELRRIWYEYPLFAFLYIIMPFLAFYSIDFYKYKKIILNGFISSGFILGLVSLFLYGKYLVQGIGRLNLVRYQTGEEVLSPLALSYSGALTIVLCIYKFVILKEKNKLQILYLSSTIILSFIMFLLGSSRGSVIALMLTLPLFLIYSPIKQKFGLIFLSILSTPVIIWALEASGSSIFTRMGNTIEDKGGGRESLWKNAFMHFIEHPIFGGKIEIGGIYPHNIILEILMATGILGTILISPVIIKGFKLGIENLRYDKTNLFVILIMIQGLTQHLFTAGFYTSTLLFVPLAILFSLSKKNLQYEN
ncbi:O-antigen ligase family protein [Flavobacteriaceae bacterium KMM 6897]|nr:O-antigen ligase family protein [Flavobacteriaceae bacterium KMM 6897]